MAASKTRRRADALLAERGLAPSRTAAAASVRAGQVRIGADGPSVEKPGQLLDADAELIVAGGSEFVSRGGTKLANALDALPVEVDGRDCLDVGASTGGFTDCLLQRGAARVIALDVGYGQLEWGLRNDDTRDRAGARQRPRALARATSPSSRAWSPPTSPSSRSAKLIAPIAAAVPGTDLDLLAMVKPQFELGPERVGKGGVVRDAAGSARRPARGRRRRAGGRTDRARLRPFRPAGPQGQPRDLHLVLPRRRRG